MSHKQVLALIGLAAAGLAVYRAASGLESAAAAYRRRGPRWDVIIPGAVAAYSLLAALGHAEAAVKRAKRVF